MGKAIGLILFLSSFSVLAQQKEEDFFALKDADYVNFAYKHWGARAEGWEANEGLRNLIVEVSQKTIDCSKKMKYVPKPTLIPPGAGYFLGYILSLREKNKKIAAYEGYEACVNKEAVNRKADAYLTQSY